MRKAIAVLLVSLIAVMPVSAEWTDIFDLLKVFDPNLHPITLSFTDRTILDYTVQNGYVIYKIELFLDNGESVSGILYFGTNAAPFKIEYTRPNPFTSTIYLEIDGVNASKDVFDPLGTEKQFLITYSINESNATRLSIICVSDECTFGPFKPGVGKIYDTLVLTPIYKVTFASNSPVNAKIGLLPYKGYIEGWKETQKIATGNYSSEFDFSNLLDFASGAYVIVSGFIWYFRLIFIDNGLLTFALFEAFVLAWSAGTSRNIWSFYRKFIRVHVALFEFLMNIIRTVVEIFYMVIQAIKPF
ncbi:hypothetical protein [Geoglobus ahangari]